MHNWIPYALVATLMWGFWGFFAKIAADKIGSGYTFLASFLGSLLLLPIYMLLFGKGFAKNVNAYYLLAAAAGISASLGTPFFYKAVSITESSSVVVLTSLYPIITTILAIGVLREALTIKKLLGIALAFMGAVLISI